MMIILGTILGLILGYGIVFGIVALLTWLICWGLCSCIFVEALRWNLCGGSSAESDF